MGKPDGSFLRNALEKREKESALRKLTLSTGLVDFCSNDYLGFARSTVLAGMVEKEFNAQPQKSNGSSGSRLLAGNTEYAERLEKEIAAFHSFDAALLFNSGYDANLGLFSSLANRGDTIIYDELVHASIRDGIRLGHAQAFSFRHNSLEGLEAKLKAAKGDIFVAVESVYSMDGDLAPLVEMVELCTRHNAYLLVDEAHAIGVFGETGKGRVAELGIQKSVLACVFTYGKAMGCDGAAVCGNELLRNFLINFSRPFIFTTAKSLHSLVTVSCAYDLLLNSQKEIDALHTIVELFTGEVEKRNIQRVRSMSPIQSIIIPGNDAVKSAAQRLQKAGFDARPIMSPTVPKGLERIRLCLHSFNSDKEILDLAKLLS
jgi:8-amino-7-oxononanoate synthase